MARSAGRALLFALLAGTGCAAERTAGGHPARAARPETRGPEIGLRRGYAWSTLVLEPPYLIGPDATMTLKGGVLSGLIAGAPLHVRIGHDGADGYGPSGPVALGFKSGNEALEVTGTWNGYAVHLDLSDGSVKGSVARGGGIFPIAGGRGGLGGRGVRGLGAPAEPGVTSYETCQYVLTEVEKDGALGGTSICGGMPEPTRLEVPRLVRAYLTRPELATVLVALLSAPPTVASESIAAPE